MYYLLMFAVLRYSSNRVMSCLQQPLPMVAYVCFFISSIVVAPFKMAFIMSILGTSLHTHRFLSRFFLSMRGSLFSGSVVESGFIISEL